MTTGRRWLKLRRLAGVSGAGARCRNPEWSEGSGAFRGPFGGFASLTCSGQAQTLSRGPKSRAHPGVPGEPAFGSLGWKRGIETLRLGHSVGTLATGRRWLRFNLVGAIGIVVQLAVLGILNGVLGLDYLPATALAVEAAVLHNFLWHQRFTWADRASVTGRQALGRLLRFNLTTGAVSILGNLLLMRLLVGQAHLPPLAANLVSIAGCSLANFLASEYIVFRAGCRPCARNQAETGGAALRAHPSS